LRRRGQAGAAAVPCRVERKAREMVERSASGLGEDGGELAADWEGKAAESR
jgi:hypothetical protein